MPTCLAWLLDATATAAMCRQQRQAVQQDSHLAAAVEAEQGRRTGNRPCLADGLRLYAATALVQARFWWPGVSPPRLVATVYDHTCWRCTYPIASSVAGSVNAIQWVLQLGAGWKPVVLHLRG